MKNFKFIMMVAVALCAALPVSAQFMPTKKGERFYYKTIDNSEQPAVTSTDTLVVQSVSDNGSQIITHLKRLSGAGDQSAVLSSPTFVYNRNSGVTQFFMTNSSAMKKVFVDVFKDVFAKSEDKKVSKEDADKAIKTLDEKLKTGGNVIISLKNNVKSGESFASSELWMKMMMFSMKVQVKNGKYLGMEKVTVPTGTYNCLKISYEVKMKMAMMGDSEYITDWYAPGIGLVKSVSSDKKGKVTGSETLIRIDKK